MTGGVEQRDFRHDDQRSDRGLDAGADPGLPRHLDADAAMSQPTECQHMGCAKPAVVGLNDRWYCVDHFSQRLKGLREQMDKLGLLFGAIKKEEPHD